MLSKPKSPEINEHTTKMIVGIIAISIGIVTCFLSELPAPLTSVSQSYFAGNWSRNFFVGFLYIIAAFLFSYNGQTRTHMVVSKVAGLAAFGVALFPCDCCKMSPSICIGSADIVPNIHYICAAIMFAVLAFFCLEFYRHASAKPHKQANWRAKIYLACFWAIVLSIALLGINGLPNVDLIKYCPRLVYWCELLGLVAFGATWLVASRVLPVLTLPSERHHPFD